MANDWFRFKKFVIRQERCAMKVGTDGVILGAWTDLRNPGKILEDPGSTSETSGASLKEQRSTPEEPETTPAVSRFCPGETRRALDIGTGTGLLALMLAQRFPDLLVDALEIDPPAANQAAENVANSDYANRIRVVQYDFRNFDPGPGVQYDLVLCNPPYFSRSHKATADGRNLARHTDTLDLENLFSGTAKILKATGKISIIIPSDQADSAKRLAESFGLFPERILEVLPIPGAAPKRHCLQFSRRIVTPAVRSIVIEEHGRHGYSDAYRELTKDFYLDL